MSHVSLPELKAAGGRWLKALLTIASPPTIDRKKRSFTFPELVEGVLCSSAVWVGAVLFALKD